MVNASAIVSGISANISAKSVSGDITLDGVTGSVDAKTVSGDLEARGLDGDIAFNSVSGDLTLAGGAVGSLTAKTVSGQVTADIDLRDDGGLRVTTVSGDVAVRVPASASARVDLKSTSGRVRSGFERDERPARPGPAVLTATLGSGSADLTRDQHDRRRDAAGPRDRPTSSRRAKGAALRPVRGCADRAR